MTSRFLFLAGERENIHQLNMTFGLPLLSPTFNRTRYPSQVRRQQNMCGVQLDQHQITTYSVNGRT